MGGIGRARGQQHRPRHTNNTASQDRLALLHAMSRPRRCMGPLRLRCKVQLPAHLMSSGLVTLFHRLPKASLWCGRAGRISGACHTPKHRAMQRSHLPRHSGTSSSGQMDCARCQAAWQPRLNQYQAALSPSLAEGVQCLLAGAAGAQHQAGEESVPGRHQEDLFLAGWGSGSSRQMLELGGREMHTGAACTHSSSCGLKELLLCRNRRVQQPPPLPHLVWIQLEARHPQLVRHQVGHVGARLLLTQPLTALRLRGGRHGEWMPVRWVAMQALMVGSAPRTSLPVQEEHQAESEW